MHSTNENLHNFVRSSPGSFSKFLDNSGFVNTRDAEMALSFYSLFCIRNEY
jgi:hypothetical protein